MTKTVTPMTEIMKSKMALFAVWKFSHNRENSMIHYPNCFMTKSESQKNHFFSLPPQPQVFWKDKIFTWIKSESLILFWSFSVRWKNSFVEFEHRSSSRSDGFHETFGFVTDEHWSNWRTWTGSKKIFSSNSDVFVCERFLFSGFEGNDECESNRIEEIVLHSFVDESFTSLCFTWCRGQLRIRICRFRTRLFETLKKCFLCEFHFHEFTLTKKRKFDVASSLL